MEGYNWKITRFQLEAFLLTSSAENPEMNHKNMTKGKDENLLEFLNRFAGITCLFEFPESRAD